MSSHDNTITNTTYLNTEIKNKGFVLLDELFKRYGWQMTKNQMNWISYYKFGHETEYFEIKIEQSKIHVSIPIRNLHFQYTTSFNDYFTASEYLEERFKDFVF
jgi:hypothetical protein